MSEEFEEEIPESYKILEKAIQDYEKEESEKKKEKIIEKADKQKDLEIDFESQMKEFTTYFDFIFEFAFSMINPLLKKQQIEPISQTEINDLKNAILSFITEKLLGFKATKITSFFAKIINLPKLIKLFTTFWKIIFPRITKYLVEKKKPESIELV